MSRDTVQFMQFIGALLGLGFVGSIIVEQKWMRGLELPFGILWILIFLGVVGFIVSGKEGAKAMVSSTLMMWGAALVLSALIAWLATAGAGHNL